MKKGAILGLVVIAVAIGVIVATYGGSSTYGSFNDARKSDGELRVIGYLDKGKQLYYDAAKDANYFSFYAKDKQGEECKVVLRNTEPQDFEKSEQIVMTGQMKAGVFEASEILMKCPSKYTQDKLSSTTVKSKPTID